MARTQEVRRRIDAIGGGWRLAYPGSPVFNEMLVIGPRSGDELARELARLGVLAGVASQRWGGSWPDGLLVAVTERCSAADIDALITAMEKVS
jgi:hypothetical protein